MQHDHTSNWDYYQGDTFKYWSGPGPQPGEEDYQRVFELLSRVYQSANLVAVGINNYRDGLISKDPNWYLTRNGDRSEDRTITEAEGLLQSWWAWQRSLAARQRQQPPLTQAVVQMLTLDDGTGIGSAYLRVYAPARWHNQSLDKSQLYRKIGLVLCQPGTIEVKRDSDNLPYWIKYEWVSGTESKRYQETHELLDSGKTRSTYHDGTVAEYDLGGLLPIVELSGPSLIDHSIRSLQNAINVTLTMCGQNIALAGFVERVILNAQMPGTWVQENGREVFHPSPNAIEFGSGRAPFLVGIPIGDPANPSGYTSPSVSYRDPAPVNTFTGSFNLLRTALFQSFGLGHLLSEGDGSLSGVSRAQIKDSWITRLHGYKPIIESAIADIFKIVLINLEALGAGQIGDLEPVVELRLNTGRTLPEEQSQTLANYNAGLISMTRAMAQLNIDDPDAEIELIRRERADAQQYDLATITPDQEAVID